MDKNNGYHPKYEDAEEDSPEMMEDAKTMLQLSSGLYRILESVAPANDEVMNSYKGLVSKA